MEVDFHSEIIPYSTSNNQCTGIWTVRKQYTDLKYIGCGGFSYVCSAFDTRLQRRVAIKKIKDGKSMIWIRTYREIKILQHIDHENIVSLLDAFTPNTSFQWFEEIYLVMPLMDKTLVNSCEKYDDSRVQTLMYQLFRAIKYLHSASLIHRDIKPSNIGVTMDDDLKLLDLGLARYRSEERNGQNSAVTAYVASRCFRAPEVLLHSGHYTQAVLNSSRPARLPSTLLLMWTDAVDVWAAGCIMSQLLTGKQLFVYESRQYMVYLEKVFCLVGGPSQDYLDTLEETTREKISNFRNCERTFDQHFHKLTPAASDLLSRVLVVDARQRITAEKALEHPYLKDYYLEGDDPDSEAFEDPLRHQESTNIDTSDTYWKESVWKLIENIVPNFSSSVDDMC